MGARLLVPHGIASLAERVTIVSHPHNFAGVLSDAALIALGSTADRARRGDSGALNP
jgi:hypothetical protein